MKTYSSTYLYSKYPNFEKNMINFILKNERIDKSSAKFSRIRDQFKERQVSSSLVKILDSNNVVLIYGGEANTKALKVIVSQDFKENTKKKKVFIDCSDLIYLDEDKDLYVCNNINILISYVTNAMVAYIYSLDKSRLETHVIMTNGAEAWAKLFTAIIDRLYKVSISNNKGKVMFMAAKYYLTNILEQDISSENVYNIAKKISGLSDREIDVIKILCDDDCYNNIKTFVANVATVIKAPKLTADIIVEKWMYIYGTGTVFALEYYPAFSAMLTDCYIGAYVNNQNQIEATTTDNMIAYTKAILECGGRCI